ncbi:MAG: ABC transporter permease [Burkholderiales bacterium]
MKQIARIGGLLIAAAALGYLALLAAGEPVLLWTDRLVFLLIAAIAGYFAYVRRHEHLAAPWRRVARSASGMAALVVLLAFVVVGVLDSLHFRPAMPGGDAQGNAIYAVEVQSALDSVLAPLRRRVETTYSAPFATRAYARELIELQGEGGNAGRQLRDFPRLRWGGAHLQDESQRGFDIFATSMRALAAGFVAWWVLAGMIIAALARRQHRPAGEIWSAVWRGETAVPWRAVLATVAVLLLVAFPVAALAARYHVLGTDKVGQDVLYLALKSIRTGLVIGTLTTLVMMPFAVLLGIMAGYFKGWVDDVIQYLYTTLNSIPSVLLIAAAVLMMQVYVDTRPELFPTSAQRADLRLLFLCIILALTSWTGLARLLRGETLKLSELEYIQAAQAFGVRDARIITRHILPNVMHIVLISLVMDFSGLVLAEAVLSYVGVGVDPSTISFGTMINAARLEMSREPVVWWALAAAFVFMFLLVLAANLFADAVRDAFDPRVRVGTLANEAA